MIDMFKFKLFIFTLLIAVFTAFPGYSQEKIENQNIETLYATVESVDFVGNNINVKTGEEKVTLFVPDGAKIILGKENIELLHLEPNDPVVIRYYTSSEGKNIVVSIVDNKPTN